MEFRSDEATLEATSASAARAISCKISGARSTLDIDASSVQNKEGPCHPSECKVHNRSFARRTVHKANSLTTTTQKGTPFKRGVHGGGLMESHEEERTLRCRHHQAKAGASSPRSFTHIQDRFRSSKEMLLSR